MTRYFFDLYDGIDAHADLDGNELHHLDIREAALRYLAETVTDALPTSVEDRKVEVSVRNADGRRVLKASIAVEVRFFAPDRLP